MEVKNRAAGYSELPPEYDPSCPSITQQSLPPPHHAGYPELPPQDAYNVAQQPSLHQTVVVMSQLAVGPKPSVVVCPSCRATIQTRVNVQAGTKTHLMALLLCCCLCWPCACLPYCMDSCRNANHYCPNCNAFIGSYKA